MPMYDAFVQSQVSFIGERTGYQFCRLEDPRLESKGAVEPIGAEAFAAFGKNLEVTHPKGGELLDGRRLPTAIQEVAPFGGTGHHN